MSEDIAYIGFAFFLFGIFCAHWAQDTNRSTSLWFFLGWFFAPITGLVLLYKNAGAKLNLVNENVQKLPIPRKWALWSTLACCVFGGGLALYATNLTLEAAQYGSANPSPCSINDWISCEAVYTTSYAMLFGIPVAWWGFLFYLCSGLAITSALLTKVKNSATTSMVAVLVTSFVAVLFSLYKASHLVKLDVLCPLCVGMYIVNLAILFLLLQSLGLPYSQLGIFLRNYFNDFFRRRSNLNFSPQPVLYVAVAVSLFSLGYIGIKDYKENTLEVREYDYNQLLTQHFGQPAVNIKFDSSASVWGNPKADITIVEFSDFECPACGIAALHLRNALFEYRSDVCLYFMNFPLDNSINKYIEDQVHSNAGLAAYAGVCSQKYGAFWDFHDDLFGNQKKLNHQMILKLVEKRGWDVTAFDACLNAETTVQRVRQDIEHAHAAGVQATPTIFINGRNLIYWQDSEFIRAVISEELKRKPLS